MAAVAVARTVTTKKPASSRGKHPKMTIVAEGGTAFTVPYAPRESTLDGLAPTFTTADRGGRQPLLLEQAPGLPTVSFDLVLGHVDRNRSIEPQLRALRTLAASGKRMRVSLDPSTSGGLWRLTGFTQSVSDRQFGTNEPTRATCSLTFQRASDAVVAVGPLSGGAKKGGSGKGSSTKSSSSKGGAKGGRGPWTYTVKKGDTLSGIAMHFYGSASKWHQIADANKIRNPRNVKVGARLRIPADS